MIKTKLHKRSSEEHYTYTNVPWKIYLRKEVRDSTTLNRMCSLSAITRIAILDAETTQSNKYDFF